MGMAIAIATFVEDDDPRKQAWKSHGEPWNIHTSTMKPNMVQRLNASISSSIPFSFISKAYTSEPQSFSKMFKPYHSLRISNSSWPPKKI